MSTTAPDSEKRAPAPQPSAAHIRRVGIQEIVGQLLGKSGIVAAIVSLIVTSGAFGIALAWNLAEPQTAASRPVPSGGPSDGELFFDPTLDRTVK